MKIVTHTDLDGISCAALFIRKYGKDIKIIYATVKEAQKISNKGFTADYTCDLPKVGNSINIDHHRSNFENLKRSNRLTADDIVDPNVASATDLVFEKLLFEGDSIAQEIRRIGHLADIAELTSEYHSLDIVSRMNSDDPAVLRQISELLAENGKLILSSTWLQENYRKVQGVYEKTKKAIEEFLIRPVQLPRILAIDVRQALPNKLVKDIFKPLFSRNVAVVALIYSKSPQEPVRVSFRVAKPEQRFYDVSKVAMKFGGGGHRMAAACSLTPKDIPETLLQELEEIAKPQDSIEYLQL
ncbi:MAG: hypothetical protein JSV04_08970 [Candidatus Heimdallarchaeota archaeon]|nr:MAG: hypothetical protein JSV04_08970 [Candidatus Heimdallarchaeota archaeon]